MDLAGQIKSDQTKDLQPGAGDIALDLGKAFLQSAVISPVCNGVGQLVTGGRLPQVSITNEENAKHSTADAWAQKIGGAAGMAVDFFILAQVSKGVFGSAAEATTARSLALGESTLLRLGEGARMGAAYGALFVPSQPGDNIVFGRLKNAASSGITFGALGGLSAAAGGVGVLGKMQPGTLAHAIKDICVTGAVGLPSGAIGAEADSFLNHGKRAEWKDIKSQAIDYGVIGLVFSGLTHGATALSAARSASLPIEGRAAAPLPMSRDAAVLPVSGNAARLPPSLDADALPVSRNAAPSAPSLDAAPPSSGSVVEAPAVSRDAAGERPVRSERSVGSAESVGTSPVRDHGAPVTSELLDTMVGRIARTVYLDQTVVEHHIDAGIKHTTLADQTQIFETSDGVQTKYPDGSEVKVSSYSTQRRSVEGKWTVEYNHWTKAWQNWGDLELKDKKAALATLDQIPPGGNLVANLVGKGLGEPDLALRKLAIQGIKLISDPEEQVNQWNLAKTYNVRERVSSTEDAIAQFNHARDYEARMRPVLIDMIPELSRGTQHRLLSGYGTNLGDIFTGMTEKVSRAGGANPEVQATDDYLGMVQDFSKKTRKSIWDTLSKSLEEHPQRDRFFYEGVEPLARQVLSSLRAGDPVAAKAFGEFASLPVMESRAIDTLNLDKPSRTDITVKPATAAAAAFKQVQDMLLTADRTEGAEAWNKAVSQAWREVPQLLEQNRDVALQKMLTDWGKSQDSGWIKDFIDWQMNTQARANHLGQEFRRLVRQDPLPSDYDDMKAVEAPLALDHRAQEYYVSSEQIAATLQNTVQLLQIADANRGPDGQLTRAGNQFRMAGLQTMAQAGDPFLIVQGTHPTCAMAQLELSTFLKHPDEASRLVNEVMRTGQYVTHDGTTIKVDPGSLRPEDLSLEMNPTRHESGEFAFRSYVSQIFQTTAANIYWQRQTTVPDGSGRQVPLGSLRYEIKSKNVRDALGNIIGQKSHDALMDYSGRRPIKVANNPMVTNFDQLVDIGDQFAGERTRPSVIETIPDNEADFERYLASLPYPESFPLILPVDGDALQDPTRPFRADNHAMSILTPFQGGRRIYFHNTWLPGGRVENNLDRDRFWEITNK